MNTIKRLINEITVSFTTCRCKSKIYSGGLGNVVGKNLKIIGRMDISISKSSIVRIGDNVTFINARWANCAGLVRHSSIFVSDTGRLNIGNNSGLSAVAIYCQNKVVIGDNCKIGLNTYIWDTDFHPIGYLARREHLIEHIRTAPIDIGDDVFIGGNSTILKGITIGSRSIIGAGSVVAKSVPAGQIWAGNPARYIRDI